MGTNFYLRKKRPTMHETIHIAKRSWGWHTTWQQTDDWDWPRWCDRDPVGEPEDNRFGHGPMLPWSIDSVDDVRRYLETGEWEVVDEYGDIADQSVIDELEGWDGGRAAFNASHPDDPVTTEPSDHFDYRDANGNNFVRGGFD